MAWGGAIIRVEFEQMLGPKCGHYSSHPWAIIYVRPRALGQVNHQYKSLFYEAEYVYEICLKIMYLLTSKKVKVH